MPQLPLLSLFSLHDIAIDFSIHRQCASHTHIDTIHNKGRKNSHKFYESTQIFKSIFAVLQVEIDIL